MGKAWRHFGAGLAVMAGLALCAPAVAAENDIRMPVDKGATPDPLGEMMKAKKPAPANAEKKPEGEKPEEKKSASKRLEPDSVARGEAKKPGEKPEEKNSEAKKPEAKPEAKKDDKKAEKKSEGKAEDKKPAPKPESPKPESPKPESPKPVAPKPVAPKAEKKPAPAPKAADNATSSAPTPAPKPEPVKSEPAKPVAQKPAPKPVAPKAEKKPAPAPKAADNATAPAPVAAPVPKPAPKPYVDPVAFVMPAGPAGQSGAPTALPAEGLFVGDVAIEFQHTQIILRAPTTKEVERVTWFYLKDQRRLALDLRGGWRLKGPGTLRYDTGPVKHVVSGEHPDRLRLVLEFREGAVRPDMDIAVVREPSGGVTVTVPLAR